MLLQKFSLANSSNLLTYKVIQHSRGELPPLLLLRGSWDKPWDVLQGWEYFLTIEDGLTSFERW